MAIVRGPISTVVFQARNVEPGALIILGDGPTTQIDNLTVSIDVTLPELNGEPFLHLSAVEGIVALGNDPHQGVPADDLLGLPDVGVIAIIDPIDDTDAGSTYTQQLGLLEPNQLHTAYLWALGSNDPTADAGEDQTVDSEEPTVTLDGSDSLFIDGVTLTYSWTQVSGTSVVITDDDQAIATFPAPVGPETLVFRLTVDDGNGATDTDDITITVSANQSPTADAGDDQTVASEAATVTLDGSGSADPENDALTYAWVQTSGTAVSLTGDDTDSPTFAAPVGPATLVFELTVDDGVGGTDTDTVTITVNGTPTADAGIDQTVASETATVTLDGTGSTDPDMDSLSYNWTQTSGPAVVINNSTTDTATFTAPTGPATLVFQLEVDDGKGGTDTDSITVNVNANQAPVADAGDDQTVASEAPTVTLDGSGSSDLEGSVTYLWAQTSGTAVSLVGPTTVNPHFAAPLGPDTLVFELTVDDGDGGTDTDSVTINVSAP